MLLVRATPYHELGFCDCLGYKPPHPLLSRYLRHVECILVLSTLTLLTPFHFFFDTDHYNPPFSGGRQQFVCIFVYRHPLADPDIGLYP
jgi:hypothetical protein